MGSGVLEKKSLMPLLHFCGDRPAESCTFYLLVTISGLVHHRTAEVIEPDFSRMIRKSRYL